MTLLDDVGEADGWRCWLCDEPVDPDMSVNDDRGPSVDSMTTQRKAKAKGTDSLFGTERLAHRGCNTKKGAVAPVVAWPEAFRRGRRVDHHQRRAVGPQAWQRGDGSLPTEADAKAAAGGWWIG